jgi:hypothetical protein
MDSAKKSLELEGAWRLAADGDVIGALLDLDEMLPEAIPIIHAEAARRGIDPAKIERLITGPSPISRGVAYILRFLQARRVLTSFLLGVVFNITARQLAPLAGTIHPAMHVITFAGIFLIGDALASWPLRNFKSLLINCLAFGTPSVLLSIVQVGIGNFAAAINDARFFLVFVTANALVAWIAPFAILAGVVWLRRKYRPVFPVGHCARCGYDLSGLPLPRCPECGLGFTPISMSAISLVPASLEAPLSVAPKP